MAEKKGLIYKFVVGKDKSDTYARSTLPSNRWELFWDVLKGRFWKLVILNLMVLVSAIPIVLLYMVNSTSISAYGSLLPFSGGVLVGVQYIPGLYQQAETYMFIMSMQTFALLIPAIMLVGVILSGVFHIIRNLVWSEAVFIANDFWKGIKSNIGSFLAISALLGLALFLANINLSSLDQALSAGTGFMANGVINTILRGLTYVFTGFLVMMAFFSFTISVTYKVRFIHLIKNSFLLSLGLLPRNLFFLALALLPFILMLLFPGGMLIGVVLGLVLLLGFSGAVLVWSIYSQWVFDTFLNDKVEGAVKNRGIYSKVDKEGKPINKKAANKFANPKKKRAVKPVTDEEVTITELPAVFSRADLKKLSDEKELMRIDSDKWAEEHANDDEYDEEIDDDADIGDDSSFEGYEDAMRLEGYEPDDNAETDDSAESGGK